MIAERGSGVATKGSGIAWRCISLAFACLASIAALFVGYAIPIVFLWLASEVLPAAGRVPDIGIPHTFFLAGLAFEVLWFGLCVAGSIWVFKTHRSWGWQRCLATATLVGALLSFMQVGFSFTWLLLALLFSR